MRKPLPLRAGDVIAVSPPAGPSTRDDSPAGDRRLSAARVRSRDRRRRARGGGGTSPGATRTGAPGRMGADPPEARAVMAARGGYGTTRILPLLDWTEERVSGGS